MFYINLCFSSSAIEICPYICSLFLLLASHITQATFKKTSLQFYFPLMHIHPVNHYVLEILLPGSRYHPFSPLSNKNLKFVIVLISAQIYVNSSLYKFLKTSSCHLPNRLNLSSLMCLSLYL